MSRKSKLLERIQRNPNNVEFRDLQRLLELYGFELKRTKGSHHSFAGEVGGEKRLVVIPYRRPLKSVYVKQVLELVEEIEADEETDQNQDEEQNDE
jgi:predicted RNA binding protein YcfA (HicA-like mRNA interferase family)